MAIAVVSFFSCHSPKKKRVVVVHSYGVDFPNYPQYHDLIEDEFDRKGIPVSIEYFYLDCEALLEDAEINRMANFLDTMAVDKPDIIIVNDDQATYSLLATHHPLAKSVPIVFAGVNYPNWGLIRQYDNVTGFEDKIDLLRNMDMVAELTGVRQMFTLLDHTFIDCKIREDAKRQLTDPKHVNNMEHWRNPKPILDSLKDSKVISALPVREPGENWGAELSSLGSLFWQLGRHTTSVYLQLKMDFTTMTMASFEIKKRFTAINELFDCDFNFYGGYLTPLSTQVEETVGAAAAILKGTSVKDIPISRSAKDYYLDWKSLDKYGINLADVPAKYHVINVPYKMLHPVAWWIAWIGGLSLAVGIVAYVLFLYARETKRRRHTQRELEEERVSLALAVRGSKMFAWKLNDGYILFEKAFWSGLSLEPHPMRAGDFLKYVHPDDAYEANNVLWQESPNESRTVDLRCDFKGNGYQWWEVRYSSRADSFGKLRTTGLLLNIQDFKNREKELEEARKMAEKADLKEKFLANMSHEIRTPLNAIVGFSNLIVAQDVDYTQEEKNQFIGLINTNSELLLKLINDILDLSRIESGYMSFTFGDYAVADVMQEIYSTHQMLMPSQLEFILERDATDISIHVDRERLTQVMTNLLGNASKFTKQGYVKTGWKYNAVTNEVELFVEDSGIGIPKEEQKAIFSRFYKLNEFAQGTGLGLSICKIIVEKLNGRLVLRSEKGLGSRFSVFLKCTVNS